MHKGFPKSQAVQEYLNSSEDYKGIPNCSGVYTGCPKGPIGVEDVPKNSEGTEVVAQTYGGQKGCPKKSRLYMGYPKFLVVYKG